MGGRGLLAAHGLYLLHVQVQTFRQEGGGGSIRQGHISCSSMDVCMRFHLRYNNIGIKRLLGPNSGAET